jgi:hypothetical protein
MSKSVLGGVAMAALLQIAAVSLPSIAQAGVVFSDDFNGYATTLNWSPPANWTAPGPGTVDLIGTGFFDFYPANVRYVDLDGSNGLPGTIQTIASFGPGKYTLEFDLGGNTREDVSKTTVFTLGSETDSITLGMNDPMGHHSYTFTTTGGQLSFSDLAGGNQNIGNILDNVTLSTAGGVPEPATWAMMLVGFAGLGAAMRRRTRAALAA